MAGQPAIPACRTSWRDRPQGTPSRCMEQRCALLYITGALCDGAGGVPRVACLQPLSSLQHHMPGEFPILKPKDSTALSPDSQDASRQLRKNTYIRFQAGHGTPLAETLLTPALQADQRSRTTHTHIHTTRCGRCQPDARPMPPGWVLPFPLFLLLLRLPTVAGRSHLIQLAAQARVCCVESAKNLLAFFFHYG